MRLPSFVVDVSPFESVVGFGVEGDCSLFPTGEDARAFELSAAVLFVCVFSAGLGSLSSYGNWVRRYDESLSVTILLCFGFFESAFWPEGKLALATSGDVEGIGSTFDPRPGAFASSFNGW